MGRRLTMEQFLGALEGVKDDGKYAARLKEISEREASLAEKLRIADTVDRAGVLESEANRILAYAKEAREESERAASDARAELMQERSRQEAEIADRVADVKQREAACDKQSADVAAARKALGEERASLAAAQQRLGEERAAFAEERRALAERVHRTKQIWQEV